MQRSVILFLDFDGVICDSASESFLTSWTAYHESFRGEPPTRPTEQARRDFFRMRPLIRSGADFMLIQDVLARGGFLNDQESFDAEAARIGEADMRRFAEIIYETRARIVKEDRAAWVGLNRIYPHMEAVFPHLPRDGSVRIISTKRPHFVAEILALKKMDFPATAVIFAEAEPKLVTVERIRAAEGYEEAILVEDQIDAIRGNTNPRLRVYLATWGYVKEEWLRAPGPIALLTPDGFLDLVKKEFSAGESRP
jgi:phosphoglycolate phosphatase-like HAD superfamily hydrolase